MEREKVCAICTKQYSKYSCPRCNIHYCSTVCYKNHGSSCTEDFYQELVGADMKTTKASEEDRKKMIETLQRIRDQDAGGQHDSGSDEGDEDDEDQDEGDGTPQEEKEEAMLQLQNLALAEADDLTLDQLTAAQRKRFLRDVARGEVSKTVAPWHPWWEPGLQDTQAGAFSPPRPPLVQDLDMDALSQSLHERDAPDVPDGSLLLPAAATGNASPLVGNSVVDLLVAYCHVSRVYNGDLQWAALEAADSILGLCPCLSRTQPHHSVRQAFSKCADQVVLSYGNQAQDPAQQAMSLHRLALARDTAQLMYGPTCALRALTHVYILMLQASKSQRRPAPEPVKASVKALKGAPTAKSRRRPQATNPMWANARAGDSPAGSTDIEAKAKLATRKVQFLLSWLHASGPGVAAGLARDLYEEWTRLLALTQKPAPPDQNMPHTTKNGIAIPRAT